MPRIVQTLTILTLLALAPALAQSNQPSFKPTSPALVLPVGQELSDGELSQIEGKALWAFVGAVVGAADAAWSCREGCSTREVVVKVATGAVSGAFFAGKAEIIEKAVAGGAKAVAHIINGVGYGAVQEGISAYKEPRR